MTIREYVVCPKCNSHRSKVIKSRWREIRQVVWRKRQCSTCGARFATEAAAENVVGRLK